MAAARPNWVSARRVNFTLMVAWGLMVPISYVTGWVYSLAFISLVSIYANFATHLAGWRADEPNEGER